MKARAALGAIPILVLATAGLLAGCGVKNDPKPPTGEVQPQVTSANRGDAAVAASDTNPNAGGVDVDLNKISTISRDRDVSAAEITRNPGASKGFILDPLLN